MCVTCCDYISPTLTQQVHSCQHFHMPMWEAWAAVGFETGTEISI